MKRLARWVGVVSLLVGFLGLLVGWTQPAIAVGVSETASEEAELHTVDYSVGLAGDKIDLNNANARAFAKHPGLYPSLARIIIGNAPYEDVKDVLNIPGLSQQQTDALQANLDNFTVTEVNAAMVEGSNRYNDGGYQ